MCIRISSKFLQLKPKVQRNGSFKLRNVFNYASCTHLKDTRVCVPPSALIKCNLTRRRFSLVTCDLFQQTRTMMTCADKHVRSNLHVGNARQQVARMK